jgi:mitofusin
LDTYLSGAAAENGFLDPSDTVQERQQNSSDYEAMEERLHAFVLQRRTFSKLYPAKTFLLHVLNDVKVLAMHRSKALENRHEDLQRGLESATPKFESMLRLKTQMFDCMDSKIEETAKQELVYSKDCLKDILADFDFLSEGVTYGGVFSAWYYASRLRSLALSLSRKKVEHCTDHARRTCFKMVETIQSDSRSVTTEQLPSIVELGLSVQSAFKDVQPLTPEIELSVTDIFGFREALDALYVPSMVLLSGALLGYRSITTGLIKLTQSFGIGNTGRLVFASIGIAGMGLF